MKTSVINNHVQFEKQLPETQFPVNYKRTVFMNDTFFLFLSVMSFILPFLTAFSMKENAWMMLLYIPICFFFRKFVWKQNNKSIKLVESIILICYALIGILCFSMLERSFMGLLNQMNIGFQFTDVISPIFCILYFSLFVLSLFCHLLSKERYVQISIILLVSVSFLLIVGDAPSLFSLVLILMFVIGESVHQKSQANHKELDRSGLTGMAIALAIFVLSCILQFVYLEIYYDHHKPFKEVTINFNRFIENTMNQNKKKDVAVGGMNKGELGKIDQVEFRDMRMLTFVSGYRGSIYLRGYIGSCYRDNHWDELDPNTKELSNQLFEQFRENKFDVYNLESCLLHILDNDNSLMEEYMGVTEYKNNVFHRNYRVLYQNAGLDLWYLPYNSNLMLQDVFSHDYPQDNETGEIASLNYYVNQIDYDKTKEFIDQYEGDNEEMLTYQKMEQLYRDYVYQTYTAVDNEAEQSVRNTIANLPDVATFSTTEEKLDYVESLIHYYQDNFEYTLSPGKVPDGKDFVTYFLSDSHKGFCTYFASAATLILREKGIPARYVEGYKTSVDENQSSNVTVVDWLRKSKVLNIKERYKEYTVDVTDRNAHAWVEIYADGLGWIPVDVTPNSSSDDQELNSALQSSDNEIYAETEPETQAESDTSIIIDENDPNAIELYRTEVAKQYHNMVEYMVENKSSTIDFGVAGKLLKRDIVWLFFFLLKLLGIVSIILFLIYLPAKMVEHKRGKLLTFHANKDYHDYELQLIAIYHYIVKLGHYYKIVRKETESYSIWARELADKKECFAKNYLEEVVMIIQKITFSKDQLTEEEIKNVIDHVREIRISNYNDCNKYEKLKYRYIYHLK